MLSQVKANCIVTDTDSEWDDIRGQQCSALNVRADSNGIFPMVEVEYQWSMCNENPFDIALRDPKAKMYDWTKKPGSKAANVADPRIPLGGEILESGTCIDRQETLQLDTTDRYNVATQLEGYVLDENDNQKDAQTGKIDAFRSFNSIGFDRIFSCMH